MTIGSLQLQEVVENIRSISELLAPEDDCRTITEVQDQIDEESTQRRVELEEVHANLKALARVFEAARASSIRPPSVPSAEQHAGSLNRLDASRLSLAKELNDTEGALASRQAELSQLKEEFRQLEESDPAAEHDLDATPLRLSVYRGLGIEPILVKSGSLDRVLVESASRDIHVVKFSNSARDDDLVEQVWKLALS
ncbi:hypothetical protein BC834DRAFT_958290 [Gloeopeniophorella convolvens]|nr:hypothetical protein BC834DRAFT_958290 [Gloeopeniophorella convolvens]